jgi:hypothetical protein
MNDRRKYNLWILDELYKLVKANPQLRFHQLLFCCDLLHLTNGILDDPFYMESEDAWNHLKNSKIYNKLYN